MNFIQGQLVIEQQSNGDLVYFIERRHLDKESKTSNWIELITEDDYFMTRLYQYDKLKYHYFYI